MTRTLFLSAISATFLLQACNPVTPAIKAEAPTVFRYTEANVSGLNPKRPYPNPDDVCVLLGKSKNTEILVVEGRDLIACPKHERGAISDRKADGAQVVGNAKHWVVLSIAK